MNPINCGSETSVFHDGDHIEVYLIPRVFTIHESRSVFVVSRVNAIFNGKKVVGDGLPLRGSFLISKPVFECNFVKLSNYINQSYFIKKPSRSIARRAIKKTRVLGMNSISGDSEIIIANQGDYIVIKSSGVTEVCPNSDFNARFILCRDLNLDCVD